MALPKILKNFLTVSTGVAFGQALSLLAMPYLSRFYSTESFGILGTFLSVATILSSLATLQYGVALMLPKRDSEAANLFALGCLSVFCLGALLSILLVMSPSLCRELMKLPNNYFLWLLPLFVLMNGVNQMLVCWSVRRKQFKQNSASQIVRSVALNSVQVATAPFLATGGVLATGSVIGEFGSCINLGYIFWKNERSFFKRCLGFKRMRQLAARYYDFPTFSTPQTLLNAISQGLPVLLLGHFFGFAVAGLYAFGMRLVQAPVGLLLNPLRQVLFQKFCELQNRGTSVVSLYRKSTLGLFAIIVLPAVGGIFLFPDLFALLFGEAWREAGEFARWLFIWQAFLFCNVPSVLMTRLLRMQRQMLIFDCATLCSRCAILVIGGTYWSARGCVAAFCLLSATLNLLLIIWISRCIKDEGALLQEFQKRVEAT